MTVRNVAAAGVLLPACIALGCHAPVSYRKTDYSGHHRARGVGDDRDERPLHGAREAGGRSAGGLQGRRLRRDPPDDARQSRQAARHSGGGSRREGSGPGSGARLRLRTARRAGAGGRRRGRGDARRRPARFRTGVPAVRESQPHEAGVRRRQGEAGRRHGQDRWCARHGSRGRARAGRCRAQGAHLRGRAAAGCRARQPGQSRGCRLRARRYGDGQGGVRRP